MAAETVGVVQAGLSIPVAVGPARFIITQVPVVALSLQGNGSVFFYDRSVLCWLACRTVFPVVIGRVVRTLQAQVKTFRYKAQVEFVNQVGRQYICSLLLVALTVKGVQTVAGAHGILRSDIQGVGLNPLAVDDTRTGERLGVHQVIEQIHFPATDATLVLYASADVDRQLMPLAQAQVKVGAVVVALVREV